MLRYLILPAALCLLGACSSDVDDGGEAQGGSGQGAEGGSSTGSGLTGNGGSGAAQVFGDCSQGQQCILVAPGCCGNCMVPTLDSMTPIAADEQQAFSEETCPEGSSGCPPCAAFSNGNLYAYCDAGTCNEGDVSQEAFSECAAPTDCSLRWGSGCCDGCSGTWDPGFGGDLIAVNTSKLPELAELVCQGDVACPDCAPQFPPDAAADCVAGRCVVIQVDPGG